MKSQNKNKVYNILISVDENILRNQREFDEEAYSTKNAIEKEFRWLHESGIYLEGINNSTGKNE